ncbi:MAG: hypothetical protein AB1486_31820 [Planctomycetota bacterium]
MRCSLGLVWLVAAAVSFWPAGATAVADDDVVVFAEDFESGRHGWSSNGVWDVGEPLPPSPPAHGGQWCAATNLTENYPDNMSNRIESPWITLPTVSGDQELRLRFWYWETVHLDTWDGTDQAYAQVLESGGSWVSVSSQMRAVSPLWTCGGVNLTSFAGKTVKIGFHASSGGRYNDLGWYVDDIMIVKGNANLRNPENFENGDGDWYVTNGMWQIGVPTAGPTTTPSGDSCAGTVLGGNYYDSAYTLLISPAIRLETKPGELPVLRFSHWYRFHSDTWDGRDKGVLQISVDGGAWADLETYINTSTAWTRVTKDFAAYTGSKVRIGFYLQTGGRYTDVGWYIDNFEITGIVGHREVGFQTFGQGLPGSGGIEPRLIGTDESSIGEYTVRLLDALGGAQAAIFLSPTVTDRPAFGGHWYVDLSGFYVFALFVTRGSGPGGGYANFFGADVSDYPGVTFYVQAAIADPGAPNSVALTKGLAMTVED